MKWPREEIAKSHVLIDRCPAVIRWGVFKCSTGFANYDRLRCDRVKARRCKVGVMATTLPKGQLQPPGGGLPAFELAWLRIFFRVDCSMISLNTGLRWFKFQRSGSECYFEGATDDLWDFSGTRTF